MNYFIRILSIGMLLAVSAGYQVLAQADLLKSVNDISSQLKTVKTSSSEWTQAFRANGQRPYLVVYEATGTDKKGQALIYVYELNLVDIDPSSIKYEIKKDEMQVLLKTFRKSGFIKRKEGQSKISYTDEVTLYASQIENARDLVAALQKSIPLAKKAMESSVKIGTTFNSLTDWLKANVVSSTSGSESFKQDLTFQEGFKNLKVKLVHQRNEKGKVDEQISDFNLADMDGSAVEMGISGEWLYLDIPTRANQKFVSFTKGGKAQNPDKSVRVYFDTVEKAREGKMILEKLLPTSLPISDSMKPAYRSVADGLEKVKQAVKKTADTEQSITADSQTVLAFNANGKAEEYRFFWGDMDEASPKIKVSGKVYAVSLDTKGKQKFIEVWKNGEKQSYTNSVEILADDIESIRYLPSLLTQMIPDCRKSLKQIQVRSGQEVEYINTHLKNSKIVSKTGTQAFESMAKCKMNFTKTTTGGKSGGTFRYELSVPELDASSVKLEVSGSSVFVTVATRNKEKTIKSFKDEVPSDFVNELKIECEDLTTGREIKECMDRIVAGCK